MFKTSTLAFLIALPLCIAASMASGRAAAAEVKESPHEQAKESSEHEEGEHHQLVLTSPAMKDVTITEQYVCQIRSKRNIKVCALDNGYLQEVLVNEGQVVKQGDTMFRIVPILYQTKWDSELAEAKVAELELRNAERLSSQNVVSSNEVALFAAKLAKARAKAKQAEAELSFTAVKAPFDGIVDRIEQQLGSLIKEGEFLTTLSDNSVMWVYFNVPEGRYLKFMETENKDRDNRKIELMLANGARFPHDGKIGAIEAQFNTETGNIPFRADFPNPERLLRNGQTGNVLIHQILKDAIVIPQRATFEILDKRYVFVVGDDHVVHQREIVVQSEQDDIFVIKSGLAVTDKFVFEGVRQVREGEKLEHFEFEKAADSLSNQKYRAE